MYSLDYGERFETLTTSVGPKPDEIDFRGGVGGDYSLVDSQPKATNDEIQVMGKP